MVDSIILKHISVYVTGYIETQSQKIELPYHNMLHTQQVVKAASQIADHYQLNEHDYFVVMTAAWFHDIGYYSGDGTQHEKNGAAMAEDFLKKHDIDVQTIAAVKGCILATQLPQRPETLPEMIVCDADLFHLGTDDFKERNKLMRKEVELKEHKDIDKAEWRKSTIALLQNHHYYTDYCQLLLNEAKEQHLKSLLKKDKETSGRAGEKKVAALPLEEGNTIGGKKLERPVRGIETMFRVAATNHQRLSDMADSKANIMISVNSIIISVVIGLVVRKLETAQNLVIPTMLLLIGCVIAVIFSVLATRPKIPDGYFTPEQVNNKTVNLLFFGNFYKMGYQAYYDGMKQVMSDSEFLYGSLIRDIHSQGIILGHKYKLLRISYTIFMFTLIISVLAFGITFIFFDK